MFTSGTAPQDHSAPFQMSDDRVFDVLTLRMLHSGKEDFPRIVEIELQESHSQEYWSFLIHFAAALVADGARCCAVKSCVLCARDEAYEFLNHQHRHPIPRSREALPVILHLEK